MKIKKIIFFSISAILILNINFLMASSDQLKTVYTLDNFIEDFVSSDPSLIIRAAPIASNFTHAEICKGTSFQGSLTGLASGGTPPYTTYTVTQAVSQGTLSLTAGTGAFTYTAPAAPASTTTTFKWTVKDSANQTSSAATYTIPVGCAATSQTIAGCIGSMITGTLSATGGTAPYTFSIAVQPTQGAVTLSGTANANFSYISNSQITGTSDSFQFTAQDSAGCFSNTNATVTINLGVTTGNFSTSAICAGSTVSSTVSGHTTVGTPPFVYSIVTQPTQGTLTLNANFTANGNFTYTANNPFTNISDSFTYQVVDANGCISNIATVSTLVSFAFCTSSTTCPNLIQLNPIIGCVGQTVQATLAPTQLSGNVLGGTPPYNFILVTQPAQGTLVLNSNFTFNGNFSYTANPPFIGTTDSFTYTATDSNGCTSNNIATQVINVGLAATSFSLSGACIGLGLVGTLFLKASGGVFPYTYTIDSNPLQGTLILDSNFTANGNFTYTPNPAFVGTSDSFNFSVRDATNCLSTPATVTINLTQFTSSGNTTSSVCPGKTLNGNLAQIFSGGVPPYTFTAITQPTQGTLNLSGNGNFAYTPNSPFRGTQDGFKFVFTDSTGCLSSVQTLIIPIGLIVSNFSTGNVCPNTSLTSTLSGSNILTITGVPPYTFSVITPTASGSLVLSPTSGIFTYTPNNNFLGPIDTFTYQVADTTSCVSNIGTVTIPIGLIAVPNQTTTAICTNSSISSSVTGAGSGGTPPYIFNIVDGPTQGTLSVDTNFSSNGKYTYFPNSSFTGTSDSFVYELVDSKLCASNPATVTIPVNKVPSAFSPPSQTLCSGLTVSNSLAGNATGGSGKYSYSIINNPPHGTVTKLSGFTSNGNYSYSSTSPFSGLDCFTYQVTDSNGCSSNLAPVDFNINANPVAANQTTAAICQGGSISGSVASLLSSGSGSFTFMLLTSPLHASSFTFNTNGSYSYTATPSYPGPSDSFSFNVTDSNGCISNTATVTIPINPNPVSTNNTLPNTCQNTARSSTLNSLVSGGTPPYSFTLIAGPSHGTLSLSATGGSFTYNPTASFTGPSDSFTYQVTDSSSSLCVSNISTITIPISPNPSATGTTEPAICQATNFTGSLTGLASNGTPPYTYSIVNNSPNGSLVTLNPSIGTFSYTAAASFTGPTDTFTFRITDSNNCFSNTATINIPINQNPVASNSTTQVVSANGTITSSLTGLVNFGTLPYSYSIVTGVSHGTLTPNPSNFTLTGNFSYTADATTNSDSFTYEASDSSSTHCTSNIATITLPRTTAPVTQNSTLSAICQGTTLQVNLTSLVSSGVPPYTYNVNQPTFGTLSPSGAAGMYTYFANATFTGPSDSFTYSVTDSQGSSSNTSTITIPINPNPIGTNGTVPSTCQNTATSGSVASFISSGTSPYTFFLVNGPTNAALFSFTASGNYSYTPSTGFTGTDNFTFYALDFKGCQSNTTTATITVLPNPSATGTTEPALCQGKSFIGSLTGLASNGTPPYTYSIVTNSPNGSLVTLNPTSGVFSYTAAASFTGPTDSFTYKITDFNTCVSNTATINIPINQNPVASNDTTATVSPNGSITSSLTGLVNFGTSPYSYSVVTGVTHGTLLPDPANFTFTGNFTYTADATTNSDSFTYQATDSSSTQCMSNIATVTIPRSGAPTAQSSTTSAICQGTTLQINLTTSVTGGVAPYTYNVNQPTFGTLSPSGAAGMYTYFASPTFAGPTDSFSYSITDTNGSMSNTATITIPINPSPAGTNTTSSGTCQNIATSGSVASQITGGTTPYTFFLASSPTHAALFSFTANGNYSYTPQTNFTGTDSFTFYATDNNGCQSNITMLTIPVFPNPIASNRTEPTICQAGSFNDTLSTLISAGTPPYTYSVVTGSPNGSTITLSPTAGTFSYIAAPTFTGPTDSFTFNVTDSNNCFSNTGAINIPINQNPVATNNTTQTVSSGGTLSSTVSGLVTLGILPYTYAVVTGVTHGTLTLTNFTLTGNFTYTADISTASDSFTYQATDSSSTHCVSNIATITIPRIGGPAAQDSTTSAICQGSTLQINLTTSVTGGIAPYTYNVNQPTFGTLSPSGTAGMYTYFASPTFAGPAASFTYSITDSTSSTSNLATVTIPINPNPIGVNQTSSGTCENITVSGSVASQISGGTDVYTFFLVAGPTHSSFFSFTANGSYTYSPTAGFTGLDNFSFYATDLKSCQSNITTLTIPVFPNPQADNKPEPPICQGGSFNSSVANVISGGTPPYMYAIITPSTHGAQINLNPTAGAFQYTGNFSYTGNQGFTGPDDTFTFQATDSNNCLSDIATVIIPIMPNPITTSSSTIPICQASSIIYSLSNNVTGGTGAYIYSIATPPTNGTVNFTGPNGTIIYTAALSFTGPSDSFTFLVTDQEGCGSNISTITIPIFTNPVSSNSTISAICQGTSYSSTLMGSSGNPPYQFDIQTDPANGVLTPAADFITSGKYTYTANITFTGPTDSFTYNVQDTNSCQSNISTITIPINPNPIAMNAIVSSLCQGSNFMSTLSSLVSSGTPPYTYIIVTQSDPQATINLNAVSGDYTYTASQSFTGPTATFTYNVVDNNLCHSAFAVITIPINPDPIASDSQEPTICQGNSLTDTLAPLVSDGTGALTYTIISPPNQGGTVILNPTSGIFTYTSDPSFPGPTEQFSYNATDSLGCSSNTATITIPINTAPFSNNKTEPTVCAGTPVTDNLSSLVVAGVPPYIYQITAPPSNGSVILNATSGDFTYTANATFMGPFDAFNYAVTDGNNCVSNNGTITLPVNVNPTAQNFTEPPLCQGFSLQDDLNLFVVGGLPPYTFTLVSGPSHAASFFLDTSTGIFIYNGDINFSGPFDSFTYTAQDANGCTSNVGTITIPIAPAPVGVNQTFNTTSNQPVIGQLQVVGGTPPYTFGAAFPNPIQGTVVISSSGAFTYTPFPSANGNDSFGFFVSDSSTCTKHRAPYGGVITIQFTNPNPIDDFFNIIIGDFCPI